MKFKRLVDFHTKLAKRLGNDLVYSLALDEGKVILVISTHKSKKQRYKDKEYKTMQSCQIRDIDFNKTMNQIVDEIANLYKNILEERPKDQPEINSEPI
jgi:phosphatidate phosphatase PAH1